jgi:hypothetical protein
MMKLTKYIFAVLFFGIGMLGVIQAILVFLQNREDAFVVGKYFTGINLLALMGFAIACMGFGGMYLIMRSKE